MKIKDFIKLFGGNEEEQIELWNCDEREEITVGDKLRPNCLRQHITQFHQILHGCDFQPALELKRLYNGQQQNELAKLTVRQRPHNYTKTLNELFVVDLDAGFTGDAG